MPVRAAVRPSSSSSSSTTTTTTTIVQAAMPCRTNQDTPVDNNVSSSRDNSRRRRPRRESNWVSAANADNILYRPDSPAPGPSSESDSAPRFPAPLIRPRRTRPHSIHVISYPPEYVPRDLRIRASSIRSTTRVRRRGLAAIARSSRHSELPLRFLITRLLSSLSGNNPLSVTDVSNPALGTLQALAASHDQLHQLHQLHSITAPPPRRRSQYPPHEPCSDLGDPQSSDVQLERDAPHSRDKRQRQKGKASCNRQEGKEKDRRRNRDKSKARNDKDRKDAHLGSSGRQHESQQQPHRHHPRYYPPNAMTSVGALLPGHHLSSPRHSLASMRHAKFPVTHVSEVPKPVATGSGVVCSILLAERSLYLSGFDHDGHGRRDGQAGTALLRGTLQLTITKNVKIKAIQLKLIGKARTEWPEGIPPLKQDTFEEESLRTQVLTFYNALNDEWETEFGNQCTYRLKSASGDSGGVTSLSGRHPHQSLTSHRHHLTAKELKQLSLQNVRSRSFGRAENGAAVSSAQAKGYKVFYPGTYDYSFELPIDHHQLETTKVPYGSVRWELHATVDRAGAFKPNLHGMKELPIVRLPDQLSLEMSEPISISRRWEDQLHYDIMVSGKSFPIGAKIPIAFKLTPLAKVRVHKIRVYVTELIEYWTNDRRVTRKDPGRKILLLEKTAGKALDSIWASSELNTIRGGELTPDQRRDAREQATRRRARDARRNRHSPQPLPPPADNILGDLDLGLENMWGATEMEANVQIPTCAMMAKNKDLRLHPDCSWKNVNVFHWIKVVMRISRPDVEDASGQKRRHFEISIDSPLTILDCRATQSNTHLPAYSNPVCRPGPYQSACGCPDAATITMETPSTPTSLPAESANSSRQTESVPTRPQAAHLHQPMMTPATQPTCAAAQNHEEEPRPIHLLRAPSFSPPAFDEDVAPPLLVDDIVPPVMTPPPRYDAVIGTPSVDGLADYFSRLADYQLGNEYDSGSDNEMPVPVRLTERSGRVNVAHPRTPGGPRIPSRSLEITRPSADLNLGVIAHASRGMGRT